MPDMPEGRLTPRQADQATFRIIENDLEAIYAPFRQVADLQAAGKDGPVDRIRWDGALHRGIEPFWRYLPPCASI